MIGAVAGIASVAIMALSLISRTPGIPMDLDMSREGDVRRAVHAYADIVGREMDVYYFDEDAAVAAVMFYPQYCRFQKGEWAGRPFILSGWQAFDIVIPVFGWKCIDGTRRFRRVHIWVPRKNGKTELMAGTALLHLIADGEFGGEGYVVATKEEQAEILFNAARRMVLLNDGLRQFIQPFKDSLYCEALFSTFRPLGGKADGSHGKGPSFRMADELHEFKDDRLIQFLDQGTGARQQPIGWDISTAGLQQGYGWELWNVCRNLWDGSIVDMRTHVAIYAADDDDDPYDPATWAKANPGLPYTPKIAYMRDQAELARRSARHENDFKRYHLNLWIGQIVRWIKMDRWNACASGGTTAWSDAFDELSGRPCFGGVDLASTKDICALVWLFPPHGGDDKWRVICRFWMPRGADDKEFADRIRQERVPYDQWEHDGAMIVTDGDAADHDAIKAQIIEDFDRYDVQGIGFDPWNAHKLMVEINELNPDIAKKVNQTMGGMSGPSKVLERLVLRGEIDHGSHPILRWMAANVATISDTNGNIKPAKDKSTQKIDGIVALIMAIALAQSEDPDANVPNVDAMVWG